MKKSFHTVSTVFVLTILSGLVTPVAYGGLWGLFSSGDKAKGAQKNLRATPEVHSGHGKHALDEKKAEKKAQKLGAWESNFFCDTMDALEGAWGEIWGAGRLFAKDRAVEKMSCPFSVGKWELTGEQGMALSLWSTTVPKAQVRVQGTAGDKVGIEVKSNKESFALPEPLMVDGSLRLGEPTYGGGTVPADGCLEYLITLPHSMDLQLKGHQLSAEIDGMGPQRCITLEASGDLDLYLVQRSAEDDNLKAFYRRERCFHTGPQSMVIFGSGESVPGYFRRMVQERALRNLAPATEALREGGAMAFSSPQVRQEVSAIIAEYADRVAKDSQRCAEKLKKVIPPSTDLAERV